MGRRFSIRFAIVNCPSFVTKWLNKILERVRSRLRLLTMPTIMKWGRGINCHLSPSLRTKASFPRAVESFRYVGILIYFHVLLDEKDVTVHDIKVLFWALRLCACWKFNFVRKKYFLGAVFVKPKDLGHFSRFISVLKIVAWKGSCWKEKQAQTFRPHKGKAKI